MGCAASRPGTVSSPSYEVSSSSYSTVSRSASASASADLGSSSAVSIWSRRPVRLDAPAGAEDDDQRRRRSGREASANAAPTATTTRLGNIRRCVEGEQAAAGWPSWLSAVAAEAVQGWVPLRAEGFEKLEKVGQGTYSSVFKARELATGRLVALKKVRFDSVEPESVRFMAREILILRRLRGHPNVVGLEGLITSRSSSAIYLVFEYLEHDLAGLTSSPDVSFSEAQIKCYMKQLLEGLAHCHGKGVMHRDIKCANLLVSDGGELKVADFGLANFYTPPSPSAPAAAPLTSRVVTLWYRPPELLLGATAYEPSVDLWSAGCVFAEMHARRPVLPGRTEVEQIHKIFKLCGSPPETFWRRPGLAHAAVFRPQHPYPSRLREAFSGAGAGAAMPDHAFRLLATLLALDPPARGTAAGALDTDYFATPPLACEPGSLPKYGAPNKEMDAKFREDSRRRGGGARGVAAGDAARGHKSMQLPDTNQSLVHAEESLPVVVGVAAAETNDDGGESRLFVDLEPVPAISKRHDGGGGEAAPCVSGSFKEAPRLAQRLPLSGPVQLAASTGFAWAKKPTAAAAAAVAKRSGSAKGTAGVNSNVGGDAGRTTAAAANTTAAPYEAEKQEMMKQWAQVADAFSTSEAYNNRLLRQTVDAKQLKAGKKYKGKVDRVDFSGPLLSQPRRIDELLQNHEQQIRRAGRRSWFKKGSTKERH
ncbi:unnamed protein product [Urochloa humidicola]